MSLQICSSRIAVFSLVLYVLAASPVAGAGDGSYPNGLRPPLAQVLAGSPGDRLVPVSVVLADQVPTQRLGAARVGLDPKAARRAVTSLLEEKARATQGPLLARLRELTARGLVSRVRPLWIGNVIGLDATPEVVREIAARPEVAWVNHNPKVDVLLGDHTPAPALSAEPWGSRAAEDVTREIECGVGIMRAPDVWNGLAVTGDGAVVAVIDTGVCHTHSDIANQMWVNPGEDLDNDGVVMDAGDVNGVDDDGNGFVDDLIGWDFDNNDREPNDDNSHGSHCAGTVAGDGTAGTQTGVAPDAKIMAVKVGVSFADEVDVWNAMQYAADNGAHTISMSLGWPHGQNPDRATWRQNCENTIEAGTAMVIAAGNEGDGADPDNVRTPGDVPRVITVGATDCSDQIAGFSSRGPVTWQDVPAFGDHPYPPGLIKPDVSGPGVDTKSHDVCSGYSFKSGTSMATPHVAGAVALMVSASPGLTHDDLKQILMDTAVDLGTPGMDNDYGAGRVDAYEAVANTATPDGRIRIKQNAVGCIGVFDLTLTDADLKGTASIAVAVFSTTEPAGETVTLTETSVSSGVFKGTALTDGGTAAADGKVQVKNADTVTARYIDASDGMGGTNVPKTDTALVDCQPPIVSAVGEDAITDTQARIEWHTDELSSSLVHWGEGVPPDQTRAAGGLVSDHSVLLTGLASCTVYWYSVESEDAIGNGAEDTNGGSYYAFETWGDFGQGLQPCHAGLLSLSRPVVACADALQIEVVDLDLNASPVLVDSVSVSVSSSTEPVPETVTLLETGPNTSRFTGSVNTAPGAATPGDGVVQVSQGDLITASYHDADDGTGAPAVSFETGDVDCSGPGISQVRVTDLTDESAIVRWTTSEPASSRVDWGTTPALGTVVTDGVLKTSHALTLRPLDECGRAHFRVISTDAYGNTRTAGAGGAPFQFDAYRIPGIFRDTFESSSGWTLEGDWQIAAPEGRGSAPPDPLTAFEGSKVLGQDLTGLGAWPGDNEPSTNHRAISPVIDASILSGGQIKFRRWLNVTGSGIARIEVKKAGTWNTVWNSPAAIGVSESAWSLQSLDISQFADGNGQLQIAFRLQSGLGGSHASSWNVDRLVVKSASTPANDACGGCGGAPTFPGLDSARDVNACAPTGISLAWSVAPAWGTGRGGTYAVFRSTDPAFVPGAANRIAAGVAGTTYTDTTAPADTNVYYVVRAENDETCGGGPANGGVTDTNLLRILARDASTQSAPGNVGGTLRIDGVNEAHARLTWGATAGAAVYRVYRAGDPQGPFVKIAETTQTAFEDRDEMGNLNRRFYVVRTADACGNEGP